MNFYLETKKNALSIVYMHTTVVDELQTQAARASVAILMV